MYSSRLHTCRKQIKSRLQISFSNPPLSITALSCAILAPLEMFSVLQGLGLLPGWPWFPHPKSFIPFSPSSPIQLPILPTTLTLGSALEYLASITVSPLFLWWIIVRTKPVVRGKLQAYIRASVPKPQRPDRYSLEAAKADELDEDSIPGLCNDPNGDPSGWESKSFLEELAKDLQYLGRKFQPLYDRLAQIISRYRTNPQHITPGGLRSQLPRTPSQSTSSTSTPDTPSNFPSTPETPPPPIEITTSIMGTNTIHMDVQISTPNTYNDPLGNNSYSNPPPTNEPEVQNENNLKETESSLYRVTTLTAFAADSMSHRLASHITELLFLPLEALFVRSLALGFLSSPRADPLAQAAASRWRSQVFPLGGWFGMGLRAGGWKGAADYAAKTALIFGMEMGFNLTVWQICTGIALVSGRRCFGWGKL